MSSIHTKYGGILISSSICIWAAKEDLFRPLSCNLRHLRNRTPQGHVYNIVQYRTDRIQVGFQVVLPKDLGVVFSELRF